MFAKAWDFVGFEHIETNAGTNSSKNKGDKESDISCERVVHEAIIKLMLKIRNEATFWQEKAPHCWA